MYVMQWAEDQMKSCWYTVCSAIQVCRDSSDSKIGPTHKDSVS